MVLRARWAVAAGIALGLLLAFEAGNSASAAVQNTVSVTITPTAAAGAGTFTQTNNALGTLSIPLSTANGQDGSIGTAASQVNYGQIQLTGSAAGSIDATAMAAFRDNFTITAPGVTTGTLGTLTFFVEVDGSVLATGGNSTTTWNLSAGVGSLALSTIASGGTGSPESPSGGDFGDPLFSAYSRTIQFQFGVPTPLDVELTAQASARVGPATDAGAAAFDFSPTAFWDGIIAVRVGTQSVGGVQLVSDSGTNWLVADPPSETPEPGTALFLAAGVIALGRRRPINSQRLNRTFRTG